MANTSDREQVKGQSTEKRSSKQKNLVDTLRKQRTTGERGSVWMSEGKEKRAPRTSVWEQVWHLKHR